MIIIKNYWKTDIADVKKSLASGIEKVEGYKKESEEIWFYCKNGDIVRMFHDQHCCESVCLYDDDGLTNGIDIFTDCEWCEVEEIIQTERDGVDGADEYDDSYTWTFYKFRTNKGYDTMRWYGTSNGYYSESVDFEIWKE